LRRFAIGLAESRWQTEACNEVTLSQIALHNGIQESNLRYAIPERRGGKV